MCLTIADAICLSKDDCCVECDRLGRSDRCEMAETCVGGDCVESASSVRTEKRLNVDGDETRHEAAVGGLRRGLPHEMV